MNWMLVITHTQFYLYSAVPTVAIFGITPIGVRLPAAIFGILGVWGIYMFVTELLSYGVARGRVVENGRWGVAIVASFFLAISPWHIQYSRAAFEVTMLLAFLIWGLYFFFESFRNGKWLWLSVALLLFTPWIYSTAKLFTPLLFGFLVLVWRKGILALPRKELFKSIIAGLIVGAPIAYSIIFGGGSQRFGYISVFSDPTRETEIGYNRQFDADVKGGVPVGLSPSFVDKFFHNKLTFWGEKITNNYIRAFSADFLFVEGDPNPRHSITGIGQFYKVEFFTLVLGVILFFRSRIERKIKLLIGYWLIIGVLPAAVTRDGGNHATRLILILPPLVFLISYGFVEAVKRAKNIYRQFFLLSYLLFIISGFVFYQHNYWVHNPWDSERWWHYGWKEAVQSIKEVESSYQKIVISTTGEPSWIFFAASYQYPPNLWHKDFPIGNDVELSGFGKVSHIDKFYFGSPQIDGSFYDWGKVLTPDTLYLANAKEININLVKEPERIPSDLKLVKAISYPSGE